MPEKRFYKKPQQPTTEVAHPLDARARTSTWCSAATIRQSGLATILAYVNPLVAWLWIGGVVMALGTVVAMWPIGRRAPRAGVRASAAPSVPAE